MNKLKKEIAELKERVYWLEDAYSKTLIESKDEKELYAYQQGRFDERRDMKAKLIDLIEEL
jgi:hypothetical protein